MVGPYGVKDILDLASFACENIIQAARDVKTVKSEVFPAEVFVDGKKIVKLTEFDVLRKKLDLGHFQVSKKWLGQVKPDKRKKVREKLNHGLQSIVWFTGIGCPLFTYPECCQAIDDALRLINDECKKMTGPLLDPELLAEQILTEPKKMIDIFDQVQSSIQNFATVRDGHDTIIDTWFNTDYCRAIGWDECRDVSPYILEEDAPREKMVQLN